MSIKFRIFVFALLLLLASCKDNSLLIKKIDSLNSKLAKLEDLEKRIGILEKKSASFQLDLLKASSKEQAVSKASITSDGSYKNDPFLGPQNAKIVMMAFSDFQCRPCRQFFSMVFPEIKKDFIDTNKIKFIFRDFPLDTNIQAKEAASLASCAGEQGAYWKAHDLLFSNIEEIDRGNLNTVIEKLGLDEKKLSRCIKSNRYLKEIEGDVKEGIKIGAKGAPGFFLGTISDKGFFDGIFIRGAQPYPALKNLIERLTNES